MATTTTNALGASSSVWFSGSGTANEKDALPIESTNGAAPLPSLETKPEQTDVKSRVDAMWEQMNKGVSNKKFKDLLKKSSTVNKTPKKASDKWKAYLGLAPKKAESPKENAPQKGSNVTQNSSSDDVVQDSSSDKARRLAAAALVEVKDAAAAASGRGKVEITEVRDFAGQEIEYKKLVDADSKEASEKAKAPAASAVDAVLEQIKKKQKLSVLDKTKKDWGEFKEEKGLDEELDAYKKSSNQYLDKVNFLQRADFREFERERDARLALQSKRRPDMREDP
ncbi:PREDICTED: craniofacial development [Prunus dulcis]|uniref:PREDICTED: craniofacial development n=1 Tax=Prunus dulcis TaxID=3755 RepID=A0A5E4GQD7_PRUDU|nr:PREDICTED: craniofacial development [Prunus dulcis]